MKQQQLKLGCKTRDVATSISDNATSIRKNCSKVTRMKCRGFVLGMRMSHNMMDGIGAAQFITALTELSKGAISLSLPPLWQRHLISARSPPSITFTHHKFEDHHNPTIFPNITHHLLFFTQTQISQLRHKAPHHLHNTSSFDLITACLWRTRTLALNLAPHSQVRLVFAVNARQKYTPSLPKGYYGNAIASVGVLCNVNELRENEFGFVLEKVVEAKKSVTDEYMRSFVDELVRREYPAIGLTMPSFYVSDLRRIGFGEMDFGWGEAVYGGPMRAWYEPYAQMESCFIMCKNSVGEEVTLVAVCLPAPNMDLFMEELCELVDVQGVDPFSKATID